MLHRNDRSSVTFLEVPSLPQPMRQLRIFANILKCLIGGVREGASQKCH